MEVNVPDSAWLEQPHLMAMNITEARKSFWELAKSRIVYRNEQEHIEFEKALFGPKWERSTAVYILSRRKPEGSDDLDKWVSALEISINKDYFGEENSDLIPYSVEHEIMESWLWSKRGISPQNSDTNHLLARIHQFEMANKDGKAEKLLHFLNEDDFLSRYENQYAYDKAKDRASRASTP